MMKRIQSIVLSLAMVLGLSVFVAAPAGAINVFNDACKGTNNQTEICKAKSDSADNLVENIVGILLWAVGVISVIMIIVGAIRFVLSAGEASSIKAARETIIYAIVGLVVALLSFVIVKFVVGWF